MIPEMYAFPISVVDFERSMLTHDVRGSVLTHPDDVKLVFRDSDRHCKGANNDAGWLMGELLGSCMGLISGPAWRQLRTSTDNAFTRQAATVSLRRIQEMSKKHIDRLHSTSSLGQGVLDPVENLQMLPFWILAEHLYGNLEPEMRTTLEALIPLRESLFRRMIQGGITRFPCSRFLPTKANRDLRDFKFRWKAFNDNVYKAWTMADKDSVFVRMYEQAQSGIVTIENILQTLDEMLFANLDVTIGGISWSLMFLAADEHVQTKLRQEIAAARSAPGDTLAWDKYLSSTETLLAASNLESARLKPAAAFSIPQAVPRDVTLGEFRIPAGTNFVVDTHALNIRNEFWGHDRDTYRPSRFLERRPIDSRYQYWRYGFGPRQCLGKHISDLIIRVTVAHLVEHYQISFDASSTWDKRPETWIAQTNTQIRCVKLIG